MVDSYADCFVVIADESKLVDRLGHSAAVPLEVLPSAMYTVENRIMRLGGTPRLRVGPVAQATTAPLSPSMKTCLWMSGSKASRTHGRWNGR